MTKPFHLRPFILASLLAVMSTGVLMTSCVEADSSYIDTSPVFLRASWGNGLPDSSMQGFQKLTGKQFCWVPDSNQEEAHALLAAKTWLELSAEEASRFGYNSLEPQAGVIVLLRGEEAMARAYDKRLTSTDRLNVWHKDGTVCVFQTSTRTEAQCTRRSRAVLAILPGEPETVYSSAFWVTVGGVY